MLSGSSATDYPAAAIEGGFISIFNNSWPVTSASDALVGDFAFDQSNGLVLEFNQQPLSISSILESRTLTFNTSDQAGTPAILVAQPTVSHIGQPPAGLKLPVDEHSEIASSIQTNTPASLYDITATFQGQIDGQAFDLDLSDPTLHKPIAVQPPLDEGESLSLGVQNNSVDEPPGLTSKTPKLQVIEDPIWIISSESVIRAHEAGGSLQVIDAVASVQQEYETQLLAVVANSIDRDGALPAISTLATRPEAMTAELARAVAFETVGYHNVAHSEPGTSATPGRNIEPQSAVPTAPTAVRPTESSVGQIIPLPRHSERLVAGHVAEPVFARSDQPESIPSDRIENEHDAAYATAISTWPLLATAAVAFWAVELRQPPVDLAVQVPPRRKRTR